MDFFSGPVPPPPTHKALDLARLLQLASRVQDAAPDGLVTSQIAEDVAADEGVPRSHVYAAAALLPDLRFASTAPVAFVACAGNCQQWGALERLEQLLRLRDVQAERGLPTFDVVARPCLEGCDRPPMVMVRTPDGLAALPSSTAEKIDEAVAAVCGG